MNIPLAVRAPIFAGTIAMSILGGTFTLAIFMQKRAVPQPPVVAIGSSKSLDAPLVAAGQHLFLMNCAHCHADDATGDEGPDLHGLLKTDGRLHEIITNGIKGEMPRFKSKLSESDVQALISFLHSLK
jgi:mono/diheme cytochrome c family protein